MTKPQYGRAHQTARAELLSTYEPGDPCCLCGHAIWTTNTRLIHADHMPGTDQYRGLSHGYPCETCGLTCNQRDGAIRGNRLRGPNSPVKRWVL